LPSIRESITALLLILNVRPIFLETGFFRAMVIEGHDRFQTKSDRHSPQPYSFLWHTVCAVEQTGQRKKPALNGRWTMKGITTMAFALVLLAGADAMAQNQGGANATGAGSTQGPAQGVTPGAKQGIEPGKAGENMNQLGSPQSGASSPQDTLMQKREQGMSPQGKGTQDSSGSMKQ
jgi:hypothetical protein